MNVLDRCRAQIRGRGMRIALPEGSDGRIVAAAQRLRAEGLAEPILLGNPAASPRLDAYAELYRQARPDASPAVARIRIVIC